jgi:hypothetical protein
MATKPALVDDVAWREPPQSLRGTPEWDAFSSFCGKTLESLRADVFDARLDRVLTLSFLEVDSEGAANVAAQLDAFAGVLKAEQERCTRQKVSKADSVGITVASAAFEAPPEMAREP